MTNLLQDYNNGADKKESNLPAHVALLLEAYDFGQFAADFNQPLAQPLRTAIRKLLDEIQTSCK